jgi:hypothetical protein
VNSRSRCFGCKCCTCRRTRLDTPPSPSIQRHIRERCFSWTNHQLLDEPSAFALIDGGEVLWSLCWEILRMRAPSTQLRRYGILILKQINTTIVPSTHNLNLGSLSIDDHVLWHLRSLPATILALRLVVQIITYAASSCTLVWPDSPARTIRLATRPYVRRLT